MLKTREWMRQLPKRKLVAQYNERRRAPCQTEVVRFLACLRENGFKEENCAAALASLTTCEASMKLPSKDRKEKILDELDRLRRHLH
ncbi:hypothetical protein GpartN1_g6263.t1 [Galdieria partita]|uniref:Uncharacterized protein n=1 Tax=Galdieria partita TaxID=83374 RepID=A0A9C7Q3D2_9RHOD|nr:hypothetical protein GpartN1_g6263.t1 [Galdieria partita]